MGIDHGLGGRDGVKSKQKREKKAKKNRVVAMRALTGGRKKEVIFDEKARTEWLGGFHKRKQERRKYGLAMEVILFFFLYASINCISIYSSMCDMIYRFSRRTRPTKKC